MAYKYPPKTATATPNLLVVIGGTFPHLFSFGSYLNIGVKRRFKNKDQRITKQLFNHQTFRRDSNTERHLARLLRTNNRQEPLHQHLCDTMW